MHDRALQILYTTALYLALPFSVYAQPVPIFLGSQPMTVAPSSPDTTASKLIYRDPNVPLTVEELSTAQRVKLQDDFMKKAGYTNTKPVIVKPPSKTNAINLVIPKPMHSLSIVGVYGPLNAQKVDVTYNGELRTLSPNSRFGKIFVESIQPGKVDVMYTKNAADIPSAKGGKKATPTPPVEVRQTMRPGDVLEIPA